LPYADHIIVLSKDGKVSEQGTFSELNYSGGYVSSFDLKSANWSIDSDEIVLLESSSDQSSIRDDIKKGTIDASVIFQEDISEPVEDDASRRMGDTTVYMYYISAVGWIPTVVFILFMCAFVTCYSYPGK